MKRVSWETALPEKTNMWLKVTDINALNNILINDFY